MSADEAIEVGRCFDDLGKEHVVTVRRSREGEGGNFVVECTCRVHAPDGPALTRIAAVDIGRAEAVGAEHLDAWRHRDNQALLDMINGRIPRR